MKRCMRMMRQGVSRVAGLLPGRWMRRGLRVLAPTIFMAFCAGLLSPRPDRGLAQDGRLPALEIEAQIGGHLHAIGQSGDQGIVFVGDRAEIYDPAAWTAESQELLPAEIIPGLLTRAALIQADRLYLSHSRVPAEGGPSVTALLHDLRLDEGVADRLAMLDEIQPAYLATSQIHSTGKVRLDGSRLHLDSGAVLEIDAVDRRHKLIGNLRPLNGEPARNFLWETSVHLGRLDITDARRLDSLRRVASYVTGTTPRGIRYDGRFVYLATDSKLLAFAADQTQSLRPRTLESGPFLGVDLIADGYAAAMTSDHLMVLDSSNGGIRATDRIPGAALPADLASASGRLLASRPKGEGLIWIRRDDQGWEPVAERIVPSTVNRVAPVDSDHCLVQSGDRSLMMIGGWREGRPQYRWRLDLEGIVKDFVYRAGVLWIATTTPAVESMTGGAESELFRIEIESAVPPAQLGDPSLALGAFNTRSIHVLKDDLVAVSSGDGGLRLYQEEAGTYQLQLVIRDVLAGEMALWGNQLLIADRREGLLHRLNISNPVNPVALEPVRPGGSILDLALKDDLLAVSTTGRQLLLYTLDGLRQPLLRSRIQFPSRIFHIALSDERVFLSEEGFAGIWEINIALPQLPQVTARSVGFRSTDLKVGSGALYSAGGRMGLTRFKIDAMPTETMPSPNPSPASPEPSASPGVTPTLSPTPMPNFLPFLSQEGA